MLEECNFLVELSLFGAIIDVIGGDGVVLLPGFPLDVVDHPSVGI